MAREKKSATSKNPQLENSVTMLEIEFATVREKLPAEYEKAIAGAKRTLGSRLKKLDTLKGRLEKATERLVKAREQKKLKTTAVVQARLDKAQVVITELKADVADFRAEIRDLRKDIADLKKRSRQFQIIEKAIQKLEKKTAESRQYRRKKKAGISATSTGINPEWERLVGEKAAPGSLSSRKEPAFFDQEIEAEV
jgi:hypothetical protein